MWWDERSWSGGAAVKPTRARATGLRASVDLDCDYVRSLVEKAFARRPEWHVEVCDVGDGEPGDEPCAAARTSLFHWGEYERIDWQRVHDGSQASSSYCVRKGLIRKAHLAHNLKKWAAKAPRGAVAAALPETYIMEVDDPEYFQEAMCDLHEVRDAPPGSATWIAKPSITNQALGVCIFSDVDRLRQAVEAAPELREWVVQRYVHPPLTLRSGRKFHLRVYALCVGSLAAYVLSDGLALFAGSTYPGVDPSQLDALTSHLTNTCYLKRAGGLADGGSGGGGEGGGRGGGRLAEDDVVRLISELPEDVAREYGLPLQEARGRVQAAWRACADVIGETFQALSSELSFMVLPNCFELFGFDLIVDADWRVWLLEANAEPDLMQTGDRLAPLIADLVDGIMELVVDPLAAAAAATAATATSAGATAASSDQFDLKKLNLASLAAAAADGQQQQKKKKQEGGSTADTTTTAAGASAASGGGSRATWVKVYEAAQRSAWGGASGVRMT